MTWMIWKPNYLGVHSTWRVECNKRRCPPLWRETYVLGYLKGKLGKRLGYRLHFAFQRRSMIPWSWCQCSGNRSSGTVPWTSVCPFSSNINPLLISPQRTPNPPFRYCLTTMDLTFALHVKFFVACSMVPLLLFLATSRSNGGLFEKIPWVERGIQNLLED